MKSRQAAAALNLAISAAFAYALMRAAFLSLSLLWILLLLTTANFEFVHSLCPSLVKWIAAKEIDPYTGIFWEKRMLRFIKKFGPSTGFYFIGELDGKRIGLSRMERFLHTLIGGPTGSRKSTSSIIPQILYDADSSGSAVVPDRKDPDLSNWVAGRWLAKGKRVFIFAPWNRANTIAINPLHNATDQDLLDIVEVLMHEYEEMIEKVQSFFQSRTKYLVYAILKLITSFKDEYANLSTAFRIVESVDVLKHFINSADPEIAALFSDFQHMHDQEQVNALTSIRERLEVFMDVDVRKAFSRPEFSLEMLFRSKDPCLFIIGAPMNKQDPGRMICSFIINLIIKKAFEERSLYKTESSKAESNKTESGKAESGEKKRSAVPKDLYLYLDELRALKVTRLADLVSIARDTKTHVIGSITDINMLRYYGIGDFSSLMGNFRTQIYMRGLDIDSCKYVSDTLGKYKAPDIKFMRDTMVGGKDEPLMSPEKIKNLSDDEIIVISPMVRPFVAKKASIYTTKWLQKMHVPAPSNMRELYTEWGFVRTELTDPVLPMAEGMYDVAAMKSGKKVPVDKDITPRRLDTAKNESRGFTETGGGKVKDPAVSGNYEPEVEASAPADNAEDDVFGAMGPI